MSSADFPEADKAIQESEKYEDIHDWVDAVVERLNPSDKNYSKKQKDLTVMLILQEQMSRNLSYKSVLNSFIEIYNKGGGVF